MKSKKRSEAVKSAEIKALLVRKKAFEPLAVDKLSETLLLEYIDILRRLTALL